MLRIIDALGAFARSPLANIVAGLILLVTALLDLVETPLEALLGIEGDVAHGAVVVGLLQVLRALPELVEGAGRLSEGEASRHERRDGE